MSDPVACALDKIRLQVAKKRLRLKDQLQDFDRLHNNTISKEQFKRCLAIGNVFEFLSQEDVDVLFDRYTAKQNSSNIDYRIFLKEMEAKEVPANAVLSTAKPVLPEDVEMMIAENIKHFVHRIQSTGLDVRLAFKDFDKRNCGKITVTQFERAFPFRIEAKSLQAIKDKYNDGNGFIYYAYFCRDVNEAVQNAKVAEQAAVSDTAAIEAHLHGTAKPHLGVEKVVGELRHQIKVNRIRFEDHFKDFDKNHSGTVTQGHFLSAMGRVKLVRFILTNEDLEGLCQRYQVDVGTGEPRISYARLFQELGGEDADSGIHKNQLTEEEDQQAEAILSKVRSAIRTRRVNLWPTFKDFDRATKGIYQCRTCTRTRFERALAINKISLTTPEVNLMEKKYNVAHPGEADSDSINYVGFCEDVDMKDQKIETIKLDGTMDSALTSPVRKSVARKAEVNEILDNVARQCYLRCLRMREFFKDFDPLHSKYMPEDKVPSALGMTSLHISEEDIQQIISHYHHPTVAHQVCYAKFIDDVEQRIAALQTQTLKGEMKPRTEEHEVQLHGILSRIFEAVKGRGILLPPFFRDYDKHHCGRITRTQFEQTLARFNFFLSQQEVMLLVDTYTSVDDPTMTQWRRFVADVDETENVDQQHALRVSARSLSPKRNYNVSEEEYKQAQDANVLGCFAKVKALLVRGIRLQEFFHDADQLRKGFMPTGKFASALSMLGAQLTEAELAAVSQFYKGTVVPDTVEYKNFVRDLETYAKETATMGASNESEEADPFLDKLLGKIRKHLESRRIVSNLLMQDFDKLRKGHVTEAQFFSVLSSVGFKFSPLETKALMTWLKAGANELGYRKFCKAVDPKV